MSVVADVSEKSHFIGVFGRILELEHSLPWKIASFILFCYNFAEKSSPHL